MLSDSRQATVCAVVCALAIGLAACKETPPLTSLPSGCRALFPGFCIADRHDDYLIVVAHKGTDLHGYVYLVEGARKGDSAQKFIALIRDLETGSKDLTEEPAFCQVHEIAQEACQRGALSSQVFKYVEKIKELDGKEANRGIRVDLLSGSGVDPAIVEAIAFPCQTSEKGVTTCGPSLPTCHRSIEWAGCGM